MAAISVFLEDSIVNTKDYLLAGDPTITAQKLARLARSRHPRVRARVAENTGASEALLVALSADAVAEVRAAVAANPRAPYNLLVYLLGDQSADVRYALAEDYDLAPELLDWLSQDQNPYVAERASKTLKRVDPYNRRKSA